MVEKFNRTFLNIIRNYVSETQDDWSTHIPLILYAYRTAVNDTTCISPAEELQVRKLRLPIDVLRPPSLVFRGENENRLFDELLDKMKVIRSKIRSNAEKSLETGKSNYDLIQNLIQLNQSFPSMKKYNGKNPYVRNIAVRNYLKYGMVLL